MVLMSFLKKLSKIDDKTKYGVHGWIRKAEKELQLGHIPLMISINGPRRRDKVHLLSARAMPEQIDNKWLFRSEGHLL